MEARTSSSSNTPPFSPPPSSCISTQIHYLCLRCMFSSAPHMFTSHIHLPASESWGEFGTSSDASPSSHQHTPSHKEYIPPSPCRKDTHLPRSQIPAMFSGNVALGFSEPPLRRPRPPPIGAKNATNYWGSRHWSLSFNPWQVPLGYYQDVNGRDRAVWHSGDWEGFRGVHRQDEQALLHQPCFDTMHCWIFIKRHYHLVSKTFRNGK